MRIHRANTIGLGLLILFGSAGKASAWDDLGHTIVCAIAFQELNDKARQEVTRLIGMDNQFKTLAESCTWPDNPKQRSNEHYINVVRDFAKFSTPTCPMASKCLFTAIDEDMRVLSTTTDDKAKLAALKFLGHWIGDLHQPLHVSFEDDRGGGKVLTSGSCGLTLHAVWDGCIVAMKLGSDWRTVARDLSKDITPSDRAAWTGTQVEAWVNESFDTARQGQVGYCVHEGNGCIYEPGHPTYNAGETEKVVVVDNAYLERNAPIVADRLRQAGVSSPTCSIRASGSSSLTPRRAAGHVRRRPDGAARTLAEALGLRPLIAHCHLGLGVLYWRAGKREKAREHLTTGTTMFGEMDMRFWLEQAEAEMRELA